MKLRRALPVKLRQASAMKARRGSGIERSPAWTIKHNGRRYAVFNSGGELQVTDARCPHNGGPLADGVVRDGTVTCPWHWYCFDLRTGECRTAASYRLRKYPVLSRDGRLFAELPGGVRRRAWLRARKIS
jgi:nitrite reductase/ring-hydroxylating ferredoxin subunit